MRVLLFDDDKKRVITIKYYLELEGIIAECLSTSELAFCHEEYNDYDVAIIVLSGKEAQESCLFLRSAGFTRGLVVLSMYKETKESVSILSAGADDCIFFPYEREELVARLKALFRRLSMTFRQDILEIGDVRLSRTTKLLKKGEKKVQLSLREFQLLELFFNNVGIVVPRDVILDRIWGLETEVSSNNIDAYVKFVRKRLSEVESVFKIKTSRGVGYSLCAPKDI